MKEDIKDSGLNKLGNGHIEGSEARSENLRK